MDMDQLSKYGKNICMQEVQPEVSPRLGSRVAPTSLAMSNDAAAERGSASGLYCLLAVTLTVSVTGKLAQATEYGFGYRVYLPHVPAPLVSRPAQR